MSVSDLGRDVLAIVLWSVFWVLVIAGAAAAYAEWPAISHLLRMGG